MTIETMLRAAKARVQRYEQRLCLAMNRPVPFQHEGCRYHVNPERAAAYHIRQSVSKIQRLVDVLTEPPEVALDVGANCGLFAAFLLQRYPSTELHSFEPSRELIPLIRANCQGRGRINECCVGETEGTCKLYVNEASQQTNSTVLGAVEPFAEASISSREVKQCSLDSYCRENGIERVGVLKLDVQGAEGDVLRGAREVLPNVAVLLIECTWLNLEAAQHFTAFARGYGFEHVTMVNPVYAGADLALSRLPVRSLDRRTPCFRLSEAGESKPWI